MKRLILIALFCLSLTAFASPLDEADTAFYTEDWQQVIDIVSAEERTAAQQSFLAACRVRRCAAALALASEQQEAVMSDEGGESVSYSPEEAVALAEALLPTLKDAGESRVDFWNYSAIAGFYAAKYYAAVPDLERSARLLEEADDALRRSARMSAHNKQLWYFSSVVYGESNFNSDFYNLSFAVSFMRRYLMISGQETDVLGLNRLSILLRKRNFTLEEKRTALVEINNNLRALSDPYKKYRYVEGYMPTTCWYNYASNHVFKNVSDATEADLIDVYLKRKNNPSTEIGSFINDRLNPPSKPEPPQSVADNEEASTSTDTKAATEDENLTAASESESATENESKN